MTPEKRRFSRIPFDAKAHINTEDGDLFLNCQVFDVSLNGLLIEKPGQWAAEMHQPCRVDLLLEDGEIVIEMNAQIAHLDSDSVGFECERIDLDSITHLKRLVELNLGDDGILHRELATLWDHD
ncbi:PilZ domain-containing protein [Methylophaga sp.]|uniref:PilZ domain-containing protein n=1 Tax=Methylophaga sp. TaxID=2024840 RepID=UPI003F69CA87